MNRSKDNFFKIGFIFLLLMNCVVLWYLLQQPQTDKNTIAPKSNDRIVQELNFDAAQEKAFFELKEQHMEMNKALKKQNRLMRQQLFSLLKDSVVNQEESKILIEKIAQNQKTFEEATFEHFSKVRSLCTPQQQQKFDEMIDGILQHLMGSRPDVRPGEGPPPPPHPHHHAE